MPIENSTSQNTKPKKPISILESMAKGAADGFAQADNDMVSAFLLPVLIPFGAFIGGGKHIIRSVKNKKKNDFKEETKNEINAHLENQSSNSSKSLTLSK